MPDFTFTSPEGKSYTVSGPEGATKEQAFQVLQGQLAQGTAHEDSATPQAEPKAKLSASDRVKDMLAEGNPLNKTGPSGEPSPSPTLAGAAKSIATSTAFGGVAGALSPEIVTGLGIAASAIPLVGPEVGEALIATGGALRAVRVGAAAAGALSGATSEGAGQAAEAVGATKGQAQAARLVGGMLSPSAGAIASYVSPALKGVVKITQRLAGVEDSVPAGVVKARENMAKMAEAGQPQTAMHAMLQKGVEAERQAADKAADAVLADAHQRAAGVAAADSGAATRIVDDARARADAIRADAAKRANVLEKASDGKLKTANRVLAQAAPELAKVGQVSELSDIGNNLRNAATVKQGEQLAARSEAYKATMAERNAAVEARESAGESVNNTPAMKELKAELDTKLLATKKGREAAKGFAPVTDAGVARAYSQVRDAIQNKRVMTGVNEDGNPTYETFKTSFEALDHVRRRLGDVVAGRDVEGYAAIGKTAAQKMYAQISRAQEEFAGPSQRVLQSEYSEASGGLTKFGSTAGRKLTAVDRVDPERFAGDPKALPKYFFNSQQSIRDAKELTGNPQLVEQQARDYSARSMQGMSAKQARAWAKDNSDWMREVPGLQKTATAYADKLEQIERVNGKLSDRAARLKKEGEATVSGAASAAAKEEAGGVSRAAKAAEGSVTTQERIRAEGAKAAEETRAKVGGAGERLGADLRSGEAPEAVRGLLLNGKPEQTRLAAQHLATQPGGQKVLEQSVRQVMRNMNENTLRQQWTERIRPMLRDGQMIPPARLDALEKDVNRLLTAYRGKDKITLIQRHIAAALGTAADEGRQ